MFSPGRWGGSRGRVARVDVAAGGVVAAGDGAALGIEKLGNIEGQLSVEIGGRSRFCGIHVCAGVVCTVCKIFRRRQWDIYRMT